MRQFWALLILFMMVSSGIPLPSISMAQPARAAPVVTAGSRAISWTLLPQTSAANPTIHDYLEVRLLNSVPGARYYRVDRVSDASGSSVVKDPYYPVWFNRTPMTFRFTSTYGQKSSVVGPHYLRLSAWSEKTWFGGSQVGTNSSVIPVYYDHSFEWSKFDLQCTVLGPGEVTIKAMAQDPAMEAQTVEYEWFEYAQTFDVKGKPVNDANGHPTFHYTGEANMQFQPEVTVSFPRPGVRYWGLTVAWNGIYGWGYTGAPLITGITSYSAPQVGGIFQPVAVVTPNENGTVDPVAVNFTGPVVTTPPIPGNVRFPLLKYDITIFNGGSLMPSLGGYNPRYIEIEVPYGISLPDWHPTGWDKHTVQNVSALVTDGSLKAGYSRLRLNKPGPASMWSYMNGDIPLQFEYNESMFNGKAFDIRMRTYDFPQNFSRTDDWQTVKVNCEAIPAIRLPERLSTGITWSSRDWLVNSSMTPEAAFLSRYKSLGFNTVPEVGTHYITPANMAAATYSPDERVGPLWQGMMYGPEHSTFYCGYFDGNGIFKVLKQKPAYMNGYDLTKFGVTLANLTMEQTKWHNALDFYNDSKISSPFMDLAYDGIWLQRDLDALGVMLNATKPDYIFIDSEDWGMDYNTWANYVNRSANANARRLPGETDDELAYRIADEFMKRWTDSVRAASPNTKIAIYGSTAMLDEGIGPFPWSILQRYGVIPQYSYYVNEKDLATFGYLLRLERENLPKGYESIPWLSSGTYGEIPSALMYDITVHAFLNGATGFSFYTPDNWDDMADVLNMAKAVGTISPYEDIVMDGQIEYDNITGVQNAVVSAMGLNGTYLIGASPKDVARPVAFTVHLENKSRPYRLRDLQSGKVINFTKGIVEFNGTLPGCTVFLLENYTIVVPNAPPVISDPQPKDGAVRVPLGTSLGITLHHNDTGPVDITWSTNASGKWRPLGQKRSVHDGTYSITPRDIFAYNRTCWWAVNASDGVAWVNRSYRFTTVASLRPSISDESPKDGTVDVSLDMRELSFNITDPEGDLMDWSLMTDPWVGNTSVRGDAGGRRDLGISGLLYNCTYNWTVKVTDPSGSRVLVQRTFTFRTVAKKPPPPPPPIMNNAPLVNANGPYRGFDKEYVRFSSNGTKDPDGTIVSFRWDFGDGSTSDLPMPVHAYASPGSYMVTLTAKDNGSLSARATTYAMIGHRNGIPRMGSITGITNGTVMVVYTYVLVATDPNGDRVRFVIDWGDGDITETGFETCGTAYAVVYSWASPGKYTISVHAVDDHNASSDAVKLAVNIKKGKAPAKGNGTAALFIGLGIALAAVVAAVLFYILYWRRRGPRKEAPDGPGPTAKDAP